MAQLLELSLFLSCILLCFQQCEDNIFKSSSQLLQVSPNYMFDFEIPQNFTLIPFYVDPLWIYAKKKNNP